MKLGIEEIRFRPRGGNYFEKIAELGFSAADYSLYDITDEIYTLSEEKRKEKLQKIAKMAQDAGVEIFQAHGPSHFQIDDKTAEGREQRMEIIKTAIRACSCLGCKNLVLHTFMSAGKNDAEKADGVFALNKELFISLSDYARGHTEVFVISAISNRPGSSLFPVPIQEITGTPASCARFTSSSFAVTVSTASTT